jgi:hypothetical protein
VPEQQSRRANPVTGSAFEAPFENQIVRFGAKGLNLRDALDALDGWARHTNLDHENTGEAAVRPGQTSVATGGTVHHSVRKLRDEQAGTETRIWGIDTSLYRGASGALTEIDSGYSGDPLTLLPHRPPLSGAPWMFVADRSRMRKVRADGLDLPIGLPAPTEAAGASLGTEYRTAIANFDASDATAAANWTGAAGADEEGNPSGVPTTADDSTTPAGDPAVGFTTQIGNASVGSYYAWWGCPLTRDLSQLSPVGGGGGTRPAADDDILHFWIKTADPARIREVRLYLVCSATFDPAILPGTAVTENTDAYVKGLRQSDFVQFIQTTQTQIEAAETARIHGVRDRDLIDRRIADDRLSWEIDRAVADPQRARSLQIGTGAHQWFELGSIGLSLRRGDFQRVGNTAGRDWATITGIVLYVRTSFTAEDQINAISVGSLYLTGGFGLDTVEPGAQQYDWRYTHYDPRTGAEGNGSPEMSESAWLDSLRRQVTVLPEPFGDAAVRQRFYRRGGSLVDDWYFEGENAADGGAFTATESDDGISAAGTLPIDHFEPVPTVDDAGTTVLAQPLPVLWGPLEGMLFGCGDPYRPGHVYYCLPDAPDHWSASGNTEVCPPSEVLMHGGLLGQQAFVFSRQRLYALYPNLTGIAGTVTSAPTLCKRGLLGRWAMVVGPGGLYFVAEDGIFVTTGGPEEWISREIQPLFDGVAKYGLLPIDKAATLALRLTVWENKLYFSYQDTAGDRQVLVYSLLQRFWRHYTFGRAQTLLQGEDEDLLLIGGLNQGATYTFEGDSDDGLAIAWTIRTGAVSGGTRVEKLFGDAFVDLDRAGETITTQYFLNEETVTNLTQTISEETGRQRYILDAFGEGPQKAHSLSLELRGATASGKPVLYQTGVAVTLQPDITNRRVTNWDDLGASDEVWLSGVTFDCDTGGVAKSVIIERDYEGQRTIVDTLTVEADGRHKVSFSWPSVPARMVRVRPDSEICEFWLLYRADWIWQAEPPRIAKWDIHFENAWDQYYTGLDLYCDTGGQEKRIEVYVDGVRLDNTLAGLPYWPVVAAGRRVVHLTLPWGRGHVFRFLAIDDHPGLLYSHRWHLEAEPSEQANWNQNFSIFGTRADKWLKAVIFECDTFGQNKQVQIEVDGTTAETLTVNASGRRVVQRALAAQVLGRVWRMFPVDGQPGRLYSAQPIFDEEPFQLDRWETQEQNHGLPGWFVPLYAHLVLKSAQPVTLTLIVQHNQPRPGSVAKRTTTAYTIPATGGEKVSHFQSFQAGKGVLVKYLLTSDEPFWLYREETTVVIQPWGTPTPQLVRPFGSDDLDPTRPMTSAVAAAQQPGGQAAT